VAWFEDIFQAAQQAVSTQGNQIASQAALQQASQSAQAFKAAAMSGQFSVDPAAVQVLVQKINNALGDLANTAGKVRVVQQQVPLGTSPGAQVMKPFLASVGDGHPQSLNLQLEALQQILIDTRDGLIATVKGYQGTDAGSAQGIRGAGGAH
jgi:hypothetical protein